MRFYLTALGCKLNQAEIESLARRILARGHQVVPEPRGADWAVVNTCTVTHVADRKSRQLVRRLHRQCPHLRIAVTGCYAEMSPGDLREMEGVRLTIGSAAKERALEHILDSASAADEQVAVPAGPRPARLPVERTRALVKIQDGCDNHCAYCIVALARGPQRSRPPERVLGEIDARLAEGYQEVILTGIRIGAYGCDSGGGGRSSPARGWTLARLVRTILERTEVPRLRLSSIEPWDLAPDLLSLWRDPRLCRHVHLPLQSGCDHTLERMGRKYSTLHYERLVDAIRGRIPGVSITTDVIVGFPGETDAEFQATLSFVERVAFSRLHVFRYSRRKGTPAAEMPHPVGPQIAQARAQRLTSLGRRMAQEFHNRLARTKVVVLFESCRAEGSTTVWQGLTDNYVRVYVSSRENLANTLAQVVCHSADETGLRGELVGR